MKGKNGCCDEKRERDMFPAVSVNSLRYELQSTGPGSTGAGRGWWGEALGDSSAIGYIRRFT